MLEKKRRSTIDLSNIISERRCDLKTNNPVSERVNSQFMTGSNQVRVSRKSGVYYIIVISLFSQKFCVEKLFEEKTFNSVVVDFLPFADCAHDAQKH